MRDYALPKIYRRYEGEPLICPCCRLRPARLNIYVNSERTAMPAAGPWCYPCAEKYEPQQAGGTEYRLIARTAGREDR